MGLISIIRAKSSKFKVRKFQVQKVGAEPRPTLNFELVNFELRRRIVQRRWSYLFAAVMVGFVGLVLAAPLMGWWLPKNVSSYGGQVDGLFYLIFGITGFFFLLTEGLL